MSVERVNPKAAKEIIAKLSKPNHKIDSVSVSSKHVDVLYIPTFEHVLSEYKDIKVLPSRGVVTMTQQFKTDENWNRIGIERIPVKIKYFFEIDGTQFSIPRAKCKLDNFTVYHHESGISCGSHFTFQSFYEKVKPLIPSFPDRIKEYRENVHKSFIALKLPICLLQRARNPKHP